MIDQILSNKAVQWIVKNSEVKIPFSDCDYTETSFSGTLPYHMCNKIREAVKASGFGFNKDGQSTIPAETSNGIEKCLSIKFGSTRSTSNIVNFFFTKEVI